MIEIALNKSLQAGDGRFQLAVAGKIDDGCFVTLFGSSGAGKTTILRMLAGLAEPDSGRLVVNGDIWFDSERKINLPPQQRSIGFVFQDYALFPNLSVRGNVGYATEKHDYPWVDELLELVGLSDLQHRLPGTLSGGQKQRVALARALARRPTLLLLDEPLSALDAGLRSRLQDDLAQLHRRFNLTTVLVSHDIGEIFKLSQRVWHLEHGRIRQSGTAAELFLQQRVTGKFNLRAQVLAIRREDVIHIVSLLIGQDIVEVIVSEDEIQDLNAGDMVDVAAKAFSSIILRQGR